MISASFEFGGKYAYPCPIVLQEGASEEKQHKIHRELHISPAVEGEHQTKQQEQPQEDVENDIE